MDYFKNGIVRPASTIRLAERHQMIKEYLETDQTKVEIWRKYTGYRYEHGALLKWMRMYGYVDDEIKRKPIFAQKSTFMSEPDDKLDKTQLLGRISQLERDLQAARLKEESYRTMIEIAEKTFKIPIIKKSDTK
ncbi:MAG: hypothetical protein AAGI25_13965 [Bacteroidota bacterium]